MTKISRFILLLLLSAVLLSACSTLLASFQQTDTQAATLTAMISPTVIAPTLDLKGNEVLSARSCAPYQVVCVSLLEDKLNGGIMKWAEDAPMFAYTAPTNRYWAWFSGDAVILDFSEDVARQTFPPVEKDTEGMDILPEIIPPKEFSTSDVTVFGNYVFNQDHSLVAFTALRQVEKTYTVMVAFLANELNDAKDLFPGTSAVTDEYASDKSVIEWVNPREVRLASSCGIDCEQLYRVNVDTGRIVPEEKVRKHGHKGRVREDHVIEYDARDYPAMEQMNWSPDERYVFYRDARDQVWIMNDDTKQQYQLNVKGNGILQTLWSNDSNYLAIRYAENITIIRVDCQEPAEFHPTVTPRPSETPLPTETPAA